MLLVLSTTFASAARPDLYPRSLAMQPILHARISQPPDPKHELGKFRRVRAGVPAGKGMMFPKASRVFA